jgi:hypothetical protein
MTTTRPTGYPEWASSATAITEPTTLEKSAGWGHTQAPPAEYFNYLQQQYYQWTKYLDEGRGGGCFGDGSDGDAVLDGVATVGWATGPSNFVYYSVRDAYAGRAAVASGVEWASNGYRIYCNNELLVTGMGRITANGGDAITLTPTGPTGIYFAGIPGNGAPAGTVGGGATGAWGYGPTTPTGGYASGIAPWTGLSVTGFGGVGGNSISAGGVTRGAGTSVLPLSTYGLPRSVLGGPLAGMIAGRPGTYAPDGGAGGGAHAQVGTWSSNKLDGGGGGGGGVLAVAARRITLATGTNLQAYGGKGGTSITSINSEIDAGGGGGGGWMHISYRDFTNANTKPTGPINCAGGIPGGRFGFSGTAGVTATLQGTGATGQPGTVFLVNVI